MTPSLGRTIPLALGLIALSSITTTVLGQGNTFNPYGNSGYADYREFGTPMYSNNPSLPGQARLNDQPIISRPRSNSFEQYTNDLNNLDTTRTAPGLTPARGTPSSNVPYYQAFRQYDQQYNRVYRPNASKANSDYESRVKQRNDAYAKALSEPDPAKRARLLRQLEQDALDRPSSVERARPKARASTSAPAASAPSSRAPSPFGTSTDRRTTAPSPFPSAARSTAPTNRAPAPPRPVTRSPRVVPPTNPATDASSVPVPPPR